VYGFSTRLEPPVDWAMDPHGSLRFQAYLSNWDFMDQLLAGYRQTGDPAYVAQAAALALDWVQSNPRANPAGGAGTWSGKIAGDRAGRLAYLLDAARCRGILEQADVEALRASLLDHVEILLGPESEGDTNHALYVQTGLAAVASQLPALPGAKRLLSTAERRFRRVLEGRLANGVWLEHSTSYQFLAIRVVERFLELARTNDPGLTHDLQAMEAAAAWLTAPDGRHTLLGDSRMLEAPPSIRRLAEEAEGLRAFPGAGLAAVREGDSHLVLSTGFHNPTHKHADELSFELSEGGRRLVTDTGMYHKDPGEIRDFVVAARAHSTLTLDDQEFPVTDPAQAYGSGLEAWGSGSGWHAVLASNPLLAEQGARHERLFLYRAGEALILVDRARAPGTHTFQRRIQLAPGVRAAEGGDAVLELEAPGFAGALFDTEPAPELALAEGSEDPLAGFMSSDYREWEPRTTVELGTEGSGLLRALTLALSPARTHADDVRWHGRDVFLRLASEGGPRVALAIDRDGRELTVSVRR